MKEFIMKKIQTAVLIVSMLIGSWAQATCRHPHTGKYVSKHPNYINMDQDRKIVQYIIDHCADIVDFPSDDTNFDNAARGLYATATKKLLLVGGVCAVVLM